MPYKNTLYDVIHDQDGYMATIHYGSGVMYKTLKTAKAAKEWIKQQTHNINVEIRIIEYEKNN